MGAELPEGFVLDEHNQSKGQLPEGFVLDHALPAGVIPDPNRNVPLVDEPGYAYGNTLPFRWKPDAQGNAVPGSVELAVPEVIRSPIRGVIEAGQQLLGQRPANDPETRGDVLSALSFAAGRAPGGRPLAGAGSDAPFIEPNGPPPSAGGPRVEPTFGPDSRPPGGPGTALVPSGEGGGPPEPSPGPGAPALPAPVLAPPAPTEGVPPAGRAEGGAPAAPAPVEGGATPAAAPSAANPRAALNDEMAALQAQGMAHFRAGTEMPAADVERSHMVGAALSGSLGPVQESAVDWAVANNRPDILRALRANAEDLAGSSSGDLAKRAKALIGKIDEAETKLKGAGPEPAPAAKPEQPAAPSEQPAAPEPPQVGKRVTFYDPKTDDYASGKLMGFGPKGVLVVDRGAGPYQFVDPGRVVNEREVAERPAPARPATEAPKDNPAGPLEHPENVPAVGERVTINGQPHTITGYTQFAPNEWTFTAKGPDGQTVTDGLGVLRNEAKMPAPLQDAPQGPWEPIGKSEETGETVYENPQGNRAVIEDGVPFVAPAGEFGPRWTVPTVDSLLPPEPIVEVKPEQPVAVVEKPKATPQEAAQQVGDAFKSGGTKEAVKAFEAAARGMPAAERQAFGDLARAAMKAAGWTGAPKQDAPKEEEKPKAKEREPKSASAADEAKPESAGYPAGPLADAWQRGRDDAQSGKPSIGTRIPSQGESGAYIEGYHSVAETPAEIAAEEVAPEAANSPEKDKLAEGDGENNPSPPLIEYTTKKGKTLKGVVRTDLTRDQAKAIDPFTFKHDGGFFIREKHIDQLPPVGASVPPAEQPVATTKPKAEKPSRPDFSKNIVDDDRFGQPAIDALRESFPNLKLPVVNARGMLEGPKDAVDFLGGWIIAKEGRVRSQARDSGPMQAGYDAFKNSAPASRPNTAEQPAGTPRALTEGQLNELDPVDDRDVWSDGTMIFPDGAIINAVPEAAARFLGYGTEPSSVWKMMEETGALQIHVQPDDLSVDEAEGKPDVIIRSPLSEPQARLLDRYTAARPPAISRPVGVSYRGQFFEVNSDREFRAEVRNIDNQGALDFSATVAAPPQQSTAASKQPAAAAPPPPVPETLAPEAQSTTGRSIDDEGRPIFKVGDRVVIPENEYGAGRHGTLTEAVGITSTPIFVGVGSGKAKTTYMYRLKTDAGAELSVSRPQEEIGLPPVVALDPFYQGRPLMPDQLERDIPRLRQNAKNSRAAADRVRKPEKKREALKRAADADREADQKQAILDKWRANPGYYRPDVSTQPDAEEPPPVAGSGQPAGTQQAETAPATPAPAPVTPAELPTPNEIPISTTQEAQGGTATQPVSGGVDQQGGGNARPQGSRAGQPAGDGPATALAEPSTEDAGPTESGGRRRKGGNGSGRKAVASPPAGDQVRDAGDGRGGASDEGVAASGTGEREEPRPAPSRPNFWVDDPETLIGGTPKVRFARNRRAIETLENITSENRAPTDDELKTMAGYIGWGSFGQDLFQGSFEYSHRRPGWDDEAKWLRDQLGKEAWESAQRSIINAHYTDPPTVQAMWDMVRQMGFQGGRILEPSMGVGNFFGMMPRDIMANSDLTGIELDQTTGRMAQLLYPQAGVHIKGYEQSRTPDNFYDLVIGNWPFANIVPADRRYNPLNLALHNYFFVKALDQTRPGGLVVGITSSFTMDSQGRAARMEMAKRGELVAAFRLPSGAFEQYAGTKVVTDIIILRKREKPLMDASQEPWVNLGRVNTPAGREIEVNQYYADHPDHVLGTLNYGSGTTFGQAGMIVDRPDDLMQRLQATPATLPTDAYQPKVRGAEPRFVVNNSADRHSSVTVGDDGNLYQVQGERLVRLQDIAKSMNTGTQAVQKKRDAQVRSLIGMRKAYGALIDAERDGLPNTEDLRKSLRDQYEAFRRAHGPIGPSDGLRVLDQVKDPSSAVLQALERPDGTPARILSEPTVRARRSIDNPSIADAYILARNESTTFDIDRVAEMSKRPVAEVAQDLLDRKAIYRTPGDGYEPADTYLSGNVRVKLAEAREALARGEPVQASVDALTEALPKDVPYYNIEVKLGAPWVGDQAYNDFIGDTLNLNEAARNNVEVSFVAGRWKVRFENKAINNLETARTLATPDVNFEEMINHAMKNTVAVVKRREPDGTQWVDEKASTDANNKIQALKDKFPEWVWADPERKIQFERAYNETMNAVAKPRFDGSFMDMSGMALRRGDDPFSLRRHQVNAIWRGVAQGRGLFAHEVGTGKTYTIAGIAVEGRRYGVHKKPLIFAHNANSAAVAKEIGDMYPGAQILYIDNLSPDTINVKLNQIANEDWDAIVMPHSLIDRMALTEETLMAMAADEIAALEAEALAAADEDGANLTVDMMDDPEAMKTVRSPTAKQLVKQREIIKNNIKKQAEKSSKEGAVPFEKLGVDAIVVDEAHEFKKRPISTRMRLKGLNTDTSNRAIGLMFLTNYVKANREGKGVYLFTGTPITNTLNEIYNQSKFFMDDRLAAAGVNDWDTWFGTFSDGRSDVELNAAGGYEPVTRLAAFVNVDELVRMMSEFTDVVKASDMPEFTPRATPSGKTIASDDLTPEERDYLENGRTDNPIGRPYKKIVNDIGEMGPEQREVLTHLQRLSHEFKTAERKQRKEWMLSGDEHSPILIETNAAKASLDVRLYDSEAEDFKDSKVNRVARNVLEIYKTPNAGQAIFMDGGYTVSKANRDAGKDFVLLDDLIAKLVAGGIPRGEIAVIAGGTDALKKKAIADGMNSGKYRVVIGQSQTLGVGVNMQTNLRAMHHVDAPWRPGDLEQRNGRGERQGNKWNTVLEYRYIVEGIDGRRWQVLAVKDRFIKEFISAFNDESGKRIGTIEGDAADIGDEDLLETLGAAAGDPRLLLKAKFKSDVERLERRERTHTGQQVQARERARQLAAQAVEDASRAAVLEDQAAQWRASVDRSKQAADAAGDTHRWYEAEIGGVKYNLGADIDEAISRVVPTVQRGQQKPIGTVGGFEIVADWSNRYNSAPYYEIYSPDQVPLTRIEAPTIRRISNALSRFGTDAQNLREQAKAKQEAVPGLEEAGRADFPQMERLLKARQKMVDLEDDLQKNPQAPPPWLRYGAPLDTEFYVDGRMRIVTGHRVSDDYYVLTEEGEVHYLDAKDAAGQNLYEEHEKPVQINQEWVQTLLDAAKAELVWADGNFALAYGPDPFLKDEMVYLAFKKGAPASEQGWNVRGMRPGSWDHNHDEHMKLLQRADDWEASKANRDALKKAEQAPEPLPQEQDYSRGVRFYGQRAPTGTYRGSRLPYKDRLRTY